MKNYFEKRQAKLRIALATLMGLATILFNTTVSAASLTASSVSLSDPRPSQASVNYSFTASSVTTAAIQCVKVVFATTATGSTKPSGMVTASGITLSASSNYIPTPASFTRGGSDADGTVTFTGAGQSPASASARTWILNGFTNSSTADTSLFMKFSTYNNVDCATSPVDSVTVAFILTNGSTLTLSVDPTLSFTISSVASGQTCNGATSTQASTSTTIPFGSVTTAANQIVCQDLVAATNAGNGYTVFIRYTGKPQSGSNLIADHTGSNATPTAFSAAGTEAYGYTTNASALQSAPANRFISPSTNVWAANTTTNAEVAYSASSVAAQTTRVGHQVGISAITRPGTYTTTVIYTCTPIY